MSLVLDSSTGQSPASPSTSITATSVASLLSRSIVTSLSPSASTSSESSSTISTTSSTNLATGLVGITRSHPATIATTQITLSTTSVLQSSTSQRSTTPSPAASVTTAPSVTTSSYKVPFPSQPSETRVYQSTGPTTTGESEPAVTIAPETPERSVHRLVIDLGDCAGFTLPRLQLIAGELGDLIAIGAGRFETELRSDLDFGNFGLNVSLKDDIDESRCGNDEYPSCVSINLTFGRSSNLEVNVLRAGGYGMAMYPFNIWLEDGVVWGAQPVDSPKEMYHCWGWSDAECPNASKTDGASGAWWTLSSNNPTEDVHINFCPSDGPLWSSIPPNPSPESYEPTGASTYIVLPTRTTLSTSTFIKPATGVTKISAPTPIKQSPCDQRLTCVTHSTFIVEEEPTTHRSTFITPVADTTEYGGTNIIIGATTTVLETSFLATPRPTAAPSTLDTSIKYLSIQTPSSSPPLTGPGARPTVASTAPGAPVPVSPPTVVPTYSYITNSLGSTVSTSSYSVTVSPAPTATSAPDTQYILTSWSTWMTVNGSTVPAIAGEVGVLSTASVTYLLESGSIIPVSELSTRTVASDYTSTPSSTAAASVSDDPTTQSRGGRVAGAVVGTLVGLVLGSILLWYICLRRRRRHVRDSFARGDPSWLGHRREAGSGGGSRVLVDLDEEPRMSSSYVEPWIPPRPVVQPPRKGGQAEMESVPGGRGIGAAMATGPSREFESSSNEGGSSWTHHGSSDQHEVPAAAATRAGKSSTRNAPTRRPDIMISQRPVASSYLNPSLANPSLSLLPTPFRNKPPSPLTPATPPSRGALLPSRGSPPPRAGPSRGRDVGNEEQGRHDAIPPLYNEAWKTAR
ncbi:unnamed protein product [Rhizoctonia solani]|uniref:Uncharacterized protein n=1 Tax=Rhizoctonia solani TaxID=456999 RepID=A0A8H3GND3_9AGAM|nr:unnamed protein product [Rhizoctonia solani]